MTVMTESSSIIVKRRLAVGVWTIPDVSVRRGKGKRKSLPARVAKQPGKHIGVRIGLCEGVVPHTRVGR
jgi:hypothetical protein